MEKKKKMKKGSRRVAIFTELDFCSTEMGVKKASLKSCRAVGLGSNQIYGELVIGVGRFSLRGSK